MEENAEKKIKILFIGNSHTFNHDVPALVKERAKADGVDCDVFMISHGGWHLKEHLQEPDLAFNIKYGGFDYVVLQEHSHPFEKLDEYAEAVKEINEMAKAAGSYTVLYGTWSLKTDEAGQKLMNETNRRIASENGIVYAGVGENWWGYMRENPDEDMYMEDGAHASLFGAKYAARVIWDAVYRFEKYLNV